jgi:hypothetical protein
MLGKLDPTTNLIIGFLRNKVRTNPRYNEFDRGFDEILKRFGFPLTIRSGS